MLSLTFFSILKFIITFLFIFWLHRVLVAARGIFVAAFKLLVVACGIQFPDQGSNPGLLHWKHGLLPMDTREIPNSSYHSERGP